MYRCPYCQEDVWDDARVCPHCTRALPQRTGPPVKPVEMRASGKIAMYVFAAAGVLLVIATILLLTGTVQGQ